MGKSSEGDSFGPVGTTIFWLLIFGGFAALLIWNRMESEPLTTARLISILEENGVSCTDSEIDTLKGSHFRDFGRCETEDAGIDLFVWNEPSNTMWDLTELEEIYGGNWAVAGRGWFVVTPAGAGHAFSLAEALDANATYIEATDSLPASVPRGPGTTGSTVGGFSGGYTGDLDCDSPGVGTNIYVGGSDPHGFDADGDGVGCES